MQLSLFVSRNIPRLVVKGTFCLLLLFVAACSNSATSLQKSNIVAILPTVHEEVSNCRHLQELRVLLYGVLPADNSYRNKHRIVGWRGFHGSQKYICHTDCVGLLDSLLLHTYRLSRHDLKEWIGLARPRATSYFSAITEENKFRLIPNIKDLLPGDILAVKFRPGMHNNGHIMIVDGPAEMIKSRAPIVENTIQWKVPIIDCTGSPHGSKDTRFITKGSHTSGVGKGILRVYTDEAGLIVGYSWSCNPKSAFYGADDRPMVAGRLGI